MRFGAASFATFVCLAGCSFDWDRLEPTGSTSGGSAGEGGSSAAGAGGVASGGMGGTASGGRGGAGGAGGDEVGPWSTPSPVTAIQSDAGFDDDPVFTADLRELYFNSDRDGDDDIWRSTRASELEPWGAPALVTEVNSAGGETNPVVSPDGLSLWIAARRDGQAVGDNDIYVSTRLTRQGAWSAPVLESGLNVVGSNEYPGSVTPDALTMMFERDGDLYVATRSGAAAAWSTVTPLTELNTADSERQAWIAPDQLTLVFDRSIAADSDIVMSTRSAASEPWGPSVPIAEIDTLDDESDAWLSPNLRYMMFSRKVDGGSEIYETFR